MRISVARFRRGGVRVHWPPRNVRQLCKFLHSFAVCGGPGRGDAAQLANSPRPRPCKACEGSPAGRGGGCPSPAQRGVQLQSAGRAAQQTFARFSGRAQLCNSRHTPPGAAHTDVVALARGYWDIAVILWLEWSSLWCNRRAPPITGARCCAVATAVKVATKFAVVFTKCRENLYTLQ